MDPVRLLMITGKGGVGKTTVAAATAVSAAALGRQVLVASTDQAHSLADVLGRPVATDPLGVAPGLEAVHLDGCAELERALSPVASYAHLLLDAAGVDDVDVHDLLGLPGVEELLVLGRLQELAASGRWDGIVVDCAPSAETLRLLSLPDVASWYLDRLFGRNGVLDTWLWRKVQRSIAVPRPDPEVLDAARSFAARLVSLRTLLRSPASSARLVVTPERVVLSESRRTFASLSLYGMFVDGVVVNRVSRDLPLSESAMVPFEPACVLRAALQDDEPIGIERLAGLGTQVHHDCDPFDLLAAPTAVEVLCEGDPATLRIPLAGVDPAELRVCRSGCDVSVVVGRHRRTVALPPCLEDREVVRAWFSDGQLVVEFGSDDGT